ncbi:hypothetical protein V8G57_19605 [Collimonas sp. H4R21]|uniref:Secreted protein n=1 Tax=Collimonas rhizosphaerae TaxID=3126357 RepID=A0ABU9Q035_9BURK
MAFDVAVDFDFVVEVAFAVAVAFDLAVAFEFRMETLPNPARVSRELWGKMFEPKASCFPHPTGTRRIWGPDRREGNGFAVAFLCLLFGARLGAKQRK